MSKIIIGVDPDSSKHGVAVYIDGKLSLIKSMPTMELRDLIVGRSKNHPADILVIHIENVCGVSNSGFHVRAKDPLPVKLKKAENVGMCKQAQREVEFMAEHLGVKIVKHPISPQWKSQAGKKMFERITGWTSRSNEDNRSAAYFGFLGLR